MQLLPSVNVVHLVRNWTCKKGRLPIQDSTSTLSTLLLAMELSTLFITVTMQAIMGLRVGHLSLCTGKTYEIDMIKFQKPLLQLILTVSLIETVSTSLLEHKYLSQLVMYSVHVYVVIQYYYHQLLCTLLENNLTMTQVAMIETAI